MPLYTVSPLPVWVAEKISTQEEADAWVAGLTPDLLISENDNVQLSDVTLLVDEDAGEFTLRFIRTDAADGPSMQTSIEPLGSYVIAYTGPGVILSTAPADFFESRHQPYPVEPEALLNVDINTRL